MTVLMIMTVIMIMITTMIMMMLCSLFGTGHEVRAEVPGQTTVEYHIGFGQPVGVGLSSGGFLDY